MSDLRTKAIRSAGKVARRLANVPSGTPGLDPEVQAAITRIRPHTMVSQEGLASLYSQVRHCERAGLPGAFVECGVWHGGSVGLIAQANLAASTHPRRLHLFDSFEGIPQPVAGVDGDRAVSEVGGNAKTNLGGDLTVANDYADRGGPGSPEDILRMFDLLGYPRDYVHIHKGWFQDTVPADASGVGPVALLRLDGDWYESTKVCIDHLYGQVVPGGFVIVDDYGAYEGCRKAIDEFIDELPQRPYLIAVNHETHYWIKPG